jgi:predicted nucleic acid-binding protein
MLLDTYAWVEYFRGTEKGGEVKNLLAKEQCFSCAISLAELSQWVESENLGEKKVIETVKKLSIIINLDNDLLEAAGKLNYHMKKTAKNFGMIDAIILATAKAYGLKIVTGDRHFENENSVMI